jgi:hypothetical protein
MTELDHLSTFDRWNELFDDRRIAVGVAIASRLAGEWVASPKLCGKKRLAEIIHQPTGIRFVAIPGGACELGMRAHEMELGAGLDMQEEESHEIFLREASTHAAVIRPFLCARAPVLAAQTTALLGIAPDVVGDEESETAAARFSREQTHALLTALGSGFRLLSGDEWEYAARDAGENAFIQGGTVEDAEAACGVLYESAFDAEDDAEISALGLWGMPLGEWIAAPHDTRACGNSRGGAAMLYPWQSDEIVMCFAGMGDDVGGFDRNGVRVAVDLV